MAQAWSPSKLQDSGAGPATQAPPVGINAVLAGSCSGLSASGSCQVYALPLSTWASGIYVDSIPGTVGSPSAGIAGLGSIPLVMSATPPTVVQNAVRGNNGLMLLNAAAPYVYVSANGVAPHVRSSTANWTIAVECRADKNGDMPVWTALRSDGDSSEQLFFRVTVGAASTYLLRKKVGGVTTDMAIPRILTSTDDSLIAVVCNAGVLTAYERPWDKSTETVTALGSMPGASLSSSVDRFTFGASLSSVPFELLSGYLTKFAECPSALSAANIAALFNTWQSSGKLAAPPAGLGAIEPGDSIMVSVDAFTGAGTRNVLGEFWGTNGLSIYPRGGAEAGGFGAQGYGRYLETSSLSGQTIAQISGQALIDISASVAKSGYWHCYMGGGDNNSLTPPATIASSFVTQATSVMNAMLAVNSHAFMSVSRLIPNQNSSIQANLVNFNTLYWYQTCVAQLQAAFPGRIYVADWWLALEQVWLAKYFGSDTGHPNRFGNIQMGLHPQYGTINALNELGETLGARMLRESPTVNRPALGSAVTYPGASASVPSGSITTCLIDVSRIGGRVNLNVDGASRGVATVLDIYDFTAAFGSYVKTPHVQLSFDWTPTTADRGTRVLTASYLDVDGVTQYTSPGVPVLVT